MTTVDLITGFLGSGKTTFIKQYAPFLIRQGEKACILVNDHGAVNVDRLLLTELEKSGIPMEMVAGGCDASCRVRRFKTKLLTLSLLGYGRIIVEPSGVFDTDEFFDTLRDEMLESRCRIGTAACLVRADGLDGLSAEERYTLASEAASAGVLIVSAAPRDEAAAEAALEKTVASVNAALEEIGCARRFSAADALPFPKPDSENEYLSDEILRRVSRAGFREAAFTKRNVAGYDSVFFFGVKLEAAEALKRIEGLFKDASAGEAIRVKGFIRDADGFISVNASKDKTERVRVAEGQDALIVIGRDLDAERLDEIFPADHSTAEVARDGAEAAKREQGGARRL